MEIACAGGRGRTGTALACVAVLDGVPAGEAVAHVRGRYDQRAVETPSQRWYVQDVSRAVPDCSVVTISVGHDVHESEPDAFAEAVLNWLRTGRQTFEPSPPVAERSAEHESGGQAQSGTVWQLMICYRP